MNKIETRKWFPTPSLFFALAFTASLLITPSAAHAEQLLHWKLDGNGFDSSGNLGDLSLAGTGASLNTGGGIFGGHLSVTSSSYANMSGTAISTLNGAASNKVSVSFWAKPNSENIGSSAFSASQTANRILQSHLEWTTGEIYWDAGNASGYSRINAAGGTTADTLHHYVMTYDGANGAMQIYKDGASFLTGSTPARTIGWTQINKMHLGAQHGNDDWAGLFDDFAVFDSVISASDVNLLRTQGVAAYERWKTDGGTGNWTDAINWVDGSIASGAGATANLNNDITSTTTSDLTSALTIGTINLSDINAINDRVISTGNSSVLTFDNRGVGAEVNNAAGNNTISTPVMLADNLTADVTSPSSLTIIGAISETGGVKSITKTGNGTQTFSGSSSNTYTGDTKVEQGNLHLNKSGGATAIAGNVTFGDGTSGQPYLRTYQDNQFGPNSVIDFINPWGQWTRFELRGTEQTLAGISSTGAGGVIQNSESGGGGNGVLTIDNATDYTFGGHFRNGNSGTLSLIKDGVGKLSLTNPAGQSSRTSHTGTTTVIGGTLELRDLGTTWDSDIINNATVELNATSLTMRVGTNESISGSGTFNKIGGGIVEFYNNTITTTGNFDIQAGVLRNNGNSVNWSGSTADINVGANGTLDLYADAIYVDELTGSGIIQNNYGNSSGFSGGAAFYEKLVIGVNNHDGGTADFSGTIRDNSSGTVPASGTAGGGVSVEKTGIGTQIFSGNSTYTGITTVNDGVLKAGSNLALGGSATGQGTTVIDGGSVELANGVNTAEPFSLNGAGFGAPGNTGALYIDDGGTATASGPIQIASNATIGAFNGSTLNLDGAIDKNGTTVTFLGNGAATNFININNGVTGTAPNSDLIVDNVTTNINSAMNYNGPTTVRNSGVLEMEADVLVQTTALTVGPGHAGAGADIGTVNHDIGTIYITGDADIGPSSGAMTSEYNLAGGTLDFRDTADDGSQANNGQDSVLTVGPSGAFNFSSGTLLNVTRINDDSPIAEFTVGDGSGEDSRFVIGSDGVDDGMGPVQAITSITSSTGGLLDFQPNASDTVNFRLSSDGTLAVDLFGPNDGLNNDMLNVIGDVTMDGTLEVNVEGFDPLPFHWYNVVVAEGEITLGSTFDLNGIPFSRVVDNPNGIGQFLQVAVPEPTTIALWSLLGLGLLSYRRWRRR